MNTIKNVVALINLNDEFEGVVHKAAYLAKVNDASLELVAIDYSSYLEDGHYFDPIQAAELRLASLEEHRLQLDEIAGPIKGEGLKVDTFAAWGHPSYKALNAHIKDPASTLVVKSTEHHNKIARLFLSNEDWDLIRHGSTNVLLVKGKSWPSAPVFVTAVDPEHVNDKPLTLDNKMVTYTKALAKVSGGSVHLFHSDSVPPFMGVYSLIMNEEDRTAKLADFGRRSGVEKSNCHWTDSPIENSLPKLLGKLDASVVVMGAISRSGLDRVLIGSTAERLLDLIDRDVLIIKPD
ncbi:MAG: universal stress protein [Pseudohongiellaceae bacterium]